MGIKDEYGYVTVQLSKEEAARYDRLKAAADLPSSLRLMHCGDKVLALTVVEVDPDGSPVEREWDVTDDFAAIAEARTNKGATPMNTTVDPTHRTTDRQQCMIVSEGVNDAGWRCRTYQRTDGTTFQTATPPYKNRNYEGWFNERAEAEMVARLMDDHEALLRAVSDE